MRLGQIPDGAWVCTKVIQYLARCVLLFDNPETVVSRQFQRSELLRSDGRHQLDRIGQFGRATSGIDELSQLK